MDVIVVADEYGGQINNTDIVENYPGIKSISGPELADRNMLNTCENTMSMRN